MITIKPQYTKDTAGKNLVILQKKDFDSLMEKLEDLEDVKRYDAAKENKLQFIDANEAFKIIESKRKK